VEKSGWLQLVIPNKPALEVFVWGHSTTHGKGVLEIFDSELTDTIVTFPLGVLSTLSVKVFGSHVLLHEGEKDVLLSAPSEQVAGEWANFLSPSSMPSFKLGEHSKLRYQFSKPLLDNNLSQGGNNGASTEEDIKARIRSKMLMSEKVIHDSVQEKKAKEILRAEVKAQIQARAIERRQKLALRAISRRRAIDAARAAEEDSHHQAELTRMRKGRELDTNNSSPSKATIKVFAAATAMTVAASAAVFKDSPSLENDNGEERWRRQHEKWQAKRLQLLQTQNLVLKNSDGDAESTGVRRSPTFTTGSPRSLGSRSPPSPSLAFRNTYPRNTTTIRKCEAESPSSTRKSKNPSHIVRSPQAQNKSPKRSIPSPRPKHFNPVASNVVGDTGSEKATIVGEPPKSRTGPSRSVIHTAAAAIAAARFKGSPVPDTTTHNGAPYQEEKNSSKSREAAAIVLQCFARCTLARKTLAARVLEVITMMELADESN